MRELSCTLEERISTKTNKPYKVLVVHLASNDLYSIVLNCK